MSLAEHKCIPCRGGVPPMAKDRVEALLRELDHGWRLNANGYLERAYAFDNFAQAMAASRPAASG